VVVYSFTRMLVGSDRVEAVVLPQGTTKKQAENGVWLSREAGCACSAVQPIVLDPPPRRKRNG